MSSNGYLARLEASRAVEVRTSREISEQFCVDSYDLALNELYGFGAERLKKVNETAKQIRKQIAVAVMDETNDGKAKSELDKEFVYTKSKVDRKLAEIFGDDFASWDERYPNVEIVAVCNPTNNREHRRRRK